MNMKHHVKLLLPAFFATASIAVAQQPFPQPPPLPEASSIPTTHTDEKVFLGFTWFTGGSMLPEIELGYRNADIDSDGDTDGYGASVSFNLTAGALDKVRLVGLYGKEDWQGEAGGGYSFVQGQPFGLLGVRGRHMYLGGELGADLIPVFGAGLHTVDEFDVPAPTLQLPELQDEPRLE